MRSAFGAIARLTQSVPETPSPLQQELARVTRVVSAIAVGVGLAFFLLSVGVAGVNPAESLIFAMGMIVAFVPEGLLPTVTLALAMGVQRMARRSALVKRLSAVETLGCTHRDLHRQDRHADRERDDGAPALGWRAPVRGERRRLRAHGARFERSRAPGIRR